ncbi:MAG: hypothetical protein B7Z06_05710 [Flavobacteriales bacterium 32-35-8]|nr:MAG: hypothetical protein B7Z06_05710 [Flavobacteriales bacterium 32-35-8]
MKNYYQILGLERDASKEDIKKAYKTYATKFHPDKQNGDKFFEERFKEILEAYEILSDDYKKANYDSKSKTNFSTGSSQYYKQYYSKSEEDLKKERKRAKRKRKKRKRGAYSERECCTRE